MVSEAPQSLKVLFVCSAPLDPSVAPLDWRKEWQHITQKLSDKNLPLKIVRLLPPTWGALQKALADGEYAVVHFSGHGDRGVLQFENEHGESEDVTSNELADLFTRTNVGLVVLNACHSGEGAESPAEALHDLEVPAVIATTGLIFDDEALLLADHLYSGLTSGRRVSVALDMAREAITREAQIKRRDPAKRAAILTSFIHRNEALFEPQEGVEGKVTVIDGLPSLRNIEHPFSFFGRSEELVRLAELLSDTKVRSVNITGLGGIGKSALADEAALRNGHRFGALIKASAEGVPDFSMANVFNAIDEVLKLGLGTLADEREKAARAAQGLNANHSLLLIDNLETVAEEEHARIVAFLERLNPLTRNKALLTMRPHIEVFEELDGAASVSLEELDAEASCLLIDNEAQHKTPPIAYLIGKGNKSNQEGLAQAAFFHPFMMKSAVGRLARSDWDSTLEALRTLEGPFEKKCQDWLDGQLALLGEDGRRLMPRLTVFVGSADKEAIEAVCGEGISVGQALDEAWQAALVDYEPNLARYNLHQIVLDYVAAKQALPPEELEALQAIHAQVFLDRAETLNAALRSEHQVVATRLFRLEWGNIRAGFEWARANEEREIEADYGLAAGEMLDLVGFWSEAERVQEIALQAAVELKDSHRQSHLNHGIGIVKKNLGKMDEAIEAHKQSREIYDELDDRRGIATSLHQMGIIHQIEGRYGEALEAYQESLEISKQLGERRLIAQTLHQMGNIHLLEGRYPEAAEACRESLEIKEQLGDRSGIAITLHQMGMLHHDQGRHDDALEAYQESLEIEEQLGNRHGTALTLAQMSLLLEKQGELAKALEHIRQAEKIFLELGSPDIAKAQAQREWIEEALEDHQS